jgi:acyl-CoA thioesterase FadM
MYVHVCAEDGAQYLVHTNKYSTTELQPQAWLFVVVEIESCFIAQANLELTILLCLPPEYWNYKYVPPLLA